MTKKQGTEKRKQAKSFYAVGKMIEAGKQKKFTRTFMAYNTGHAAQKLLSLLGSNHGVQLRNVEIEELREGEGA